MRACFLLVALLQVATGLWAHEGSKAEHEAAAVEMSEGADHFLRGLTPEQHEEANLPFASDERYNWHYIPRDRKGVSFKILSPAQKKLADALLSTGLSHQGMKKALDIMYLDQILFERERRAIRDPEAYYFTVFGSPSADGRWGWRVEGHHLSLNFTIENGKVISTSPAFYGSNPAIVHGGSHDGMRVLADEEIRGRELLLSFAKRDRVLILAEAPSDIVTKASRRAEIGAPVGVAYRDMTPSQKEAIVRLIGVYARRMRPDVAEAMIAHVEAAGLDEIRFAWAGGANEGEPHYYRIHGPTFLVEYDNTQNDANHIHSVWRDLEHDFGGDVLAAHYVTSPHHRHAEE